MSQTFTVTDADLMAMPLALRDGAFADKAVVISGAGRGIGKALAFAFVRLGARVAINGRDAGRLAATEAALRSLGAEVFARAMTISDPEAVARFLKDAHDYFGGFDILVNNAGGQFPQAAIDFSVKGWHAVIDTNLNGSWYMMQQAARLWRDAGRPGSIVNIVAVVTRGTPGIAHTGAARAGVIYLSKTLAIEWAPLGIRINCVAPGAIATEGMDVYPAEARNTFAKSNVLHRFGDVVDVVDAVTYIAGPSGKFITGEVLTVDGGNQLYGEQWAIPKPDYYR
jgi:citronellol/citronellal dehydrogenase